MNEAVVQFTLGTCPLITIFPFIFLARAYNEMTEDEKETTGISLTSLLIGLPILYGVTFAFLYTGMSFFPRKTSNGIYLRFVMSGGIAGLCMSFILHYFFNIYEEWFHIENVNMIHIFVFLFYLIYFYTIGQWIRYQVLYGPQPPKRISPPSSVSSRRSRRSTRDTNGETSFEELVKLSSK